MSIIKKAPLMAFGLGLGLMITMAMSSFTNSKQLDTTYYYWKLDGVNYSWTTTAPTGSITCKNSPANQCSGTFATSPDAYPATNYSSITVGQLR